MGMENISVIFSGLIILGLSFFWVDKNLCCILLFTPMFRVWSPCDIHTPRHVRQGEGVKRHSYKITPTNKHRNNHEASLETRETRNWTGNTIR